MNHRLNLIAATLAFLIVLSTNLVLHSASAQAGSIDNLLVGADRPDYNGGCPAEIKLKGQFRANVEGLGVVRYQFVHSDGTQGAMAQITINHKGVYTVEDTLRQNRSWTDTVFLRVFLATARGPIPLDSNRITIKGQCQEVRAVPRQATISLGPATGRFRITLNGFTCNHQTAELNNPLLRDGADDEVFLFTKSFRVEKRADGNGVNVSPPYRSRTPVIGDTSLFPDRTQGGSGRYLGGNGGFRAGDSFPSSPEKHSVNPQPYALPQLIWEGELTRRQNAMVIIPMIWESDGIYGLFQAWESAGLEQFSSVGELISDPNLTNQESAKVALRGEVRGQVWMNGRGGGVEPQDRPIGMRSDDRDYRFRPEVLILTYDEALRMAVQQRSDGKASPVVYADAPELGGNYTLYIQVEQMP